MSASNKKQLRREQETAALTEKQLKEQKEARNLKIYSIIAVAVLVLLVAIAIYGGVSKSLQRSGWIENNTTAATVGNHNISAAEMNFFFVDSINSFYKQYSDYIAFLGLDVTKPLSSQVIDEESGKTWADSFMDQAKSNIASTYALADAAKAEGFELSDAQQASINAALNNMTYSAIVNYNYDSLESYLKTVYGNGANIENFRKYYELNTLAQAYYDAHQDALTYDDDALRAAEAENYNEFSSYDFVTYPVNVSKYLTGGTKDDSGKTTYSDAERAAAEAAAKADAVSLANAKSVEELDEAIAGLSVNAETTAASTKNTAVLYGNVSSIVRDWVTASERKAGDITYLPYTTTSTDENGNETETVNSYYVVLFQGMDENKYDLANVRHILISFEGGTKNEDGQTVYSEEEKNTAKDKAQAVLDQWKAGEKTEESFAALVKDNSSDGGSVNNGGLYENIRKGQIVEPFEEWCLAPHNPGDTGLVETTYGWHVMYYCGSNYTYRDFMIRNSLVSKDMETWYNALVEPVTVTEKNVSMVNRDMVISPASVS